MTFQTTLHTLVDGNDLTEDEMVSSMTEIMEGEVTDVNGKKQSITNPIAR